ncbi:hypothetical protein QQP08_004407 [Theobroma cacao]|nr:hypothetical protein QQP08_004407 [Theobroma cacao]
MCMEVRKLLGTKPSAFALLLFDGSLPRGFILPSFPWYLAWLGFVFQVSHLESNIRLVNFGSRGRTTSSPNLGEGDAARCTSLSRDNVPTGFLHTKTKLHACPPSAFFLDSDVLWAMQSLNSCF